MNDQIKKNIEAAKQLKLSDDVAARFDLVGLAGAGKIVTNKLKPGQLVEVNLSKISVEEAETLVKNGFKYLKFKRNAPIEPAGGKDAKKA